MTLNLPISVRIKGKTDMRSQFAALCYRLHQGKVQVLLITSRGTGRWIIPKGWPEYDQSPAETAALEAWEEAGAKGRAENRCVGLYSYVKRIEKGQNLPCVVMVFPFEVKKLQRDYPERDQRKRKWFSRKKAAQKVGEPELARILRDFDPRTLH